MTSFKFHQWLFSNQEIMTEVFLSQVSFIESALISPNKLFVQSNKMLKFYATHLKNLGTENVLFVSIDQPNTMSDLQKTR